MKTNNTANSTVRISHTRTGSPRFRARGEGKNDRAKNEKIKIIPLGGLEQIGMNITCIEYEDNIVVIRS